MDRIDIYNKPAQNLRWGRTLCDTLQEMRKCYETRNFGPIASLIEEAQIYGNRMEAKLTDIKEYDRMKERYKKISKKVKEMEKLCEEKDESNSFDLDKLLND
jgi:hypothetical protein